MKTSDQLATKLATENAAVKKLTLRDLRARTGPSREMKEAATAAKRTWRLWSNALDVEAGRAPCFPVDAAGNLTA